MNPQLNRTLKTRSEINEATAYLKANNLIEHGLDCKNLDIALVAHHLKDGNVLAELNICDLGADGSWVLWNAVRMGLKGEKHGIDLHIPSDVDYGEIQMVQGDLMHTPYQDAFFDYVTCMSVVEHQISYKALAEECARILKPGGNLIMSADYWTPKPDTSKMKLYSLSWDILDQNDVMHLVQEMNAVGLFLTSEIDFSTQDAVINPQYCSPAQGVSYTFIYLHFIKQ